MKTLAVSIALVLISLSVGVLHLTGVITIPFSDIGEAIVTGFIPVVITIVAFSALVILALTLRNQAEVRNRELDYLEAAAEIDAVRRQGELVNAIRLRLSVDTGDSEEERQDLAEELVTAAERYYTVLRGFIRARPEIARIEREAIASYLAEAEAEVRRLRADGSAAFEDIPIVSPFALSDSPSEAADPFDDEEPPGNSIGDILSEGADNERRRA
ncbi:MAG: oligoendopeptidase F family protein [Dehalococcoidia bacterium]|nr:oligoendopeptidase F family protein [Dehalococcoidia bacterium]